MRVVRLTRIDEDTIEQKGTNHESQEQPNCLFALLNLYHWLSEVAARQEEGRLLEETL